MCFAGDHTIIMALGHGLLGCLLMYLVLVASFLPQGFAMRLTGGTHGLPQRLCFVHVLDMKI